MKRSRLSICRASFAEKPTSDNFVRTSMDRTKKSGFCRTSTPCPHPALPLISEYGIPYSNRTHGMIPLDPLPNLIDQVYTRILEAITDRTLPPGHRIRQNELAEKLGVSRQPISHALHLLHRQGLVAESGRKGFEVTQLDPRRIRELYEVRGAIDALAARLAAERRKTDAVGRVHLETAL